MHPAPRPHLPRLLGALCLLTLLAAVTLAPSAGASGPVFSTTVTMRITYATNCIFAISIDATINGVVSPIVINTSSAPGVTIPPGTYQVVLRTPQPDDSFDPGACQSALFSLNGPGASYSFVSSSFANGATFNQTFQPGGTYVADDANHPAQTQLVFTTATSGSNASLLPPVSTAPSGPTATSVQTDLIGSAILPYRGKLQATVSRSGAATLTAHGAAVTTLKAGVYDIVASDQSPRVGLSVGKLHHRQVPLSGTSFTGKRTVRVTISAGSWTFDATGANADPFTVSG